MRGQPLPYLASTVAAVPLWGPRAQARRARQAKLPDSPGDSQARRARQAELPDSPTEHPWTSQVQQLCASLSAAGRWLRTWSHTGGGWPGHPWPGESALALAASSPLGLAGPCHDPAPAGSLPVGDVAVGRHGSVRNFTISCCLVAVPAPARQRGGQPLASLAPLVSHYCFSRAKGQTSGWDVGRLRLSRGPCPPTPTSGPRGGAAGLGCSL